MKTTDEPVGIAQEDFLKMENQRLKEIIDIQNQEMENLAGEDVMNYVKEQVGPIMAYVSFLEGENTKLKEVIKTYETTRHAKDSSN